MLTGYNTGCPTGNPEEFLLGFNPVTNQDSISANLPIAPAPGCGEEYWVFGCDGVPQEIRYISEGSEQVIRVVLNRRATRHSFFAEPLGGWADLGDFDYEQQALDTQATNATNVRIGWDVGSASEIVETLNDAQQFSNWVLAGMTRWGGCRRHNGSGQEGEIDVTLEFTGGLYVVTLWLSSAVVATGSRATATGSVTLAEQNSSGLSGTVDIDYTADVTNGLVVKRWPKSYDVELDVLTTTVNDDGISESFSAVLGPLPPDTYDATVTPVSDTGVAGTPLTSPVTLLGGPQPPGLVSYVSGDITATIVHFQASTTVGATYRYYDSQDVGGPIFVEAIAATRGAGTGVLSLTLPSMSAGVAGDRWGRIVAVSGGVEDSLQRSFSIPYDVSGNYVPSSPNVPTLAVLLPVTSGRTVSLRYTYDPTGQVGVGTKIKLKTQAEDGTITLATSVSLPTTGTPRVLDVTTTPAANGWYRFAAAGETAGGVLSDYSAYSDWIFVSDVVLSAPSGLTLTPLA